MPHPPGPWPGPYPPVPPPYPYYPPPWDNWDDDVWPVVLPLGMLAAGVTGYLLGDDGDSSSGDTYNTYNTYTTQPSTAGQAANPAAKSTAQSTAKSGGQKAAPTTGVYYGPQDGDWPEVLAQVSQAVYDRYIYEKKTPGLDLSQDPPWFDKLSRDLDARTAAWQAAGTLSSADLARDQMGFINEELRKTLGGIDKEGSNYYVMTLDDPNRAWSLLPKAGR